MECYDSIFDCIEVRDYKLTINAYQLCGRKYLQQFWIWTGIGANGKSVEGGLLEKTLGGYSYNPNITMFTTKKNDASKADPQLAKSRGRRMIISSESDAKDRLISSQLKEWTGNDKIQARGLYASNIEFYPQFAINLLCNVIPKFTTFAQAEARRTKIVDYPFTFVDNPKLPHEKKIDEHLSHKFSDTKYLQQYMLILLEKYEKCIKGEHGKGKPIQTPEKVNAVTKQFFNEQDVVGQFIDACLDRTDNTKDKVEKKDMYCRFIEHLKDEGMGEDHMIPKAFHTQMVAKGCVTKRQHYHNMSFKQEQVFQNDNNSDTGAGSDDEL
jgi:P4 family phage/plasmid primase-like protien